MSNYLRLAVVLGSICIFGATQRTFAQQPTTTQGIPIKSEFTKLYQQYQSETSKIDDWAKKLDTQICAREFLTSEEGDKFDDLIVQPNLTPIPKNQLEALVKTGLNRRNDYQRGTAGQLLPPEGYGRLRTLKEMKTGNQEDLRQIGDKLLSILRQQQNDVDKEFTGKINKLFGNNPIPKD